MMLPIHTSRQRVVCVLVTCLTMSACVTDDPPPPGPTGDMSTQDLSSNPDRDADIVNKPDLEMDSSPDLAPPDMGPPMICTPFAKECASETIARTCDAVGMAWDEVTCQPGELCEDGVCVVQPICEEGTATCLDSMSRQVCRPGGMMFATQACENGTSCIDGECLSGDLNGTVCQAHDDCAGGKCHCGDQTGEGCSDTFTTPGYCTSECTTSADCSASEWCFSSEVHLITGQASNYNHCVPRCQGICGNDAYTCAMLPIIDEGGAMDWQEGCYFKGTKEIGEVCDSDVECLGGYCLKDYLSTGYCSRRCEEGSCPGDASCVKLKQDEYWCTLKCGDGISSSGVCPLDQPDDRLDVTCAYRQDRSGNNARVCVSTSN